MTEETGPINETSVADDLQSMASDIKVRVENCPNIKSGLGQDLRSPASNSVEDLGEWVEVAGTSTTASDERSQDEEGCSLSRYSYLASVHGKEGPSSEKAGPPTMVEKFAEGGGQTDEECQVESGIPQECVSLVLLEREEQDTEGDRSKEKQRTLDDSQSGEERTSSSTRRRSDSKEQDSLHACTANGAERPDPEEASCSAGSRWDSEEFSVYANVESRAVENVASHAQQECTETTLQRNLLEVCTVEQRRVQPEKELRAVSRRKSLDGVQLVHVFSLSAGAGISIMLLLMYLQKRQNL
jgi:hypothetical protein